MKWIILLILTWILISWCCSCTAQRTLIQHIHVKSVHDGDTFYDYNGKSYRLSEIDCPEIGQPYGEEARRFTDSLIGDKWVTIYNKGKDPYCRIICTVILPDNVDLGKLIVSSGYAWVYRKYSSEHMYAVYVFAKRKHKGMWIHSDNEPPFIYRQNHK